MKYIKTYENMNKLPEIGDYVLMRVNLKEYSKKEDVNKFINNSIGQVMKIYPENEEVRVKYYNIPDNIKDWFLYDSFKKTYSRVFNTNRIVDIKTKEDFDLYNNQNKYNL
jgi:hypothetical protein